MFTRNKNNTELVGEVDLLPADVLVVCRQKVVVGRGRVEATQAGNQLEMGGKEGETVALKKKRVFVKNAFEIFVISNRINRNSINCPLESAFLSSVHILRYKVQSKHFVNLMRLEF